METTTIEAESIRRMAYKRQLVSTRIAAKRASLKRRLRRAGFTVDNFATTGELVRLFRVGLDDRRHKVSTCNPWCGNPLCDVRHAPELMAGRPTARFHPDRNGYASADSWPEDLLGVPTRLRLDMGGTVLETCPALCRATEYSCRNVPGRVAKRGERVNCPDCRRIRNRYA